MLTFDEDNLRDVAEVLIKINPSLDGFYVDYVMDRMRANAEKCYAEDPNFGYFSIYGYVLTLYNGYDDKPSIKASICAYTVMTFLKDNRLRLKKKAA
jgi:hypothetical protein